MLGSPTRTGPDRSWQSGPGPPNVEDRDRWPGLDRPRPLGGPVLHRSSLGPRTGPRPVLGPDPQTLVPGLRRNSTQG